MAPGFRLLAPGSSVARRSSQVPDPAPRIPLPAAKSYTLPVTHPLDAVPFSGIIRIRDMMYAVKDPFRLDQGDVSFDAPETVKRAMHRAIDDNRSHYVQTTGIPPLL